MMASIRLTTLFLCMTCAAPWLIAATPPPSVKSSSVRYKWLDAQGGVHFSDTLPAEALQRGYDVVDAQGLAVKHVDRPKTADERKAEAMAAASKAEAKERADAVAAADRRLLATYPTDDDLAAVHKDRLDAVEKMLNNVKISLADQEKGLEEQLSHADTFERDNKPIPASVKQQIESLRKTIATQNAFIVRREQERVDLIRQSEAEMTHYRELRTKQAQAAARQ